MRRFLCALFLHIFPAPAQTNKNETGKVRRHGFFQTEEEPASTKKKSYVKTRCRRINPQSH